MWLNGLGNAYYVSTTHFVWSLFPISIIANTYVALIGGLSSIIGLEPVRDIIGLNLDNPAMIGLSTLAFSLILMIIGSILFPDKINEVQV